MKIKYIVNARIPTEKAHGYQIAKMCESFAARGVGAELIVPFRANTIDQDVFSYYGVSRNFVINHIKCLDMFRIFARFPRFAFYLQALSFLLGLRKRAVSDDSVVMTRNAEIAWWYGRKGYRVFYDAHSFPTRVARLLKWLLKGTAGIITNSGGTAATFRQAGFVKTLVAPNAVDLAQFNVARKQEKSELGLPEGRIAMYVGHLYDWKGAAVVVEAARRSKIKDLSFVFVGGTDEDIIRYKSEAKNLKNVLFLGRRAHCEIPALMKSSDALLLPNIPSTRESILYTSPIKMFEYMASGVPIVASDLPSIREVLDEKDAVLVKPGDPDDLLRGIECAFGGEAREKTVRAREKVLEYTWDARAAKITRFMIDQQ